MKYVPAYTFLPRLAAAAMMGSVLGLAGCGSGSDGNMAPDQKKLEGTVAPTSDGKGPITATSSEDYNKQMAKQAAGQNKPYPSKK
jgi:hypothetical protein